MNIQRINAYDDPRFRKNILLQHGAFLIDGSTPSEFEIIGPDTAVIRCQREDALDALIDEFRFYAEHITRFVDESGRIFRKFPAVRLFWTEMDSIQPSQFYADEEKLEAVRSFIKTPEDVVIPLIEHEGRYVSLDGHTRLYAAREMGFTQVRGFLTQADPYILKFVGEAQRRGIYSVRDIALLSHAEYCVKWHKFCDDFFAEH